jgi:3-oxoacyl-[acyl-carrier protein] reductase
MIIVTGGSSGLGKAITEDLREAGEEVITISRREEPHDRNHISCDITSYESLKEVYRSLSKSGHPVRALINCSGIASMNLAITTPPSVTEKVIRTNLIGTIYANQIFAPLLIRNKGGRIINFSTIAVHIGLKGESVYVASKAGVEGFSRVFAKELAPFKITVNCIAPGPIKTNLLKGISDDQIQKIVDHQSISLTMKPCAVTEIVNLLLKEESRNITGEVINVGGV